MKKNIILYSFIALLSGTAGCSDMLDQYPLDAISPETYYNNADELRSATNQFYGMFPGAASGYTESADVVCTFNLPAEVQGIRTVPTSGGGWNWEYLRAVNFYLSHSVRCDDVDAREHFDGIARFFRAYFYFEKVKRFGEVPWFDRELSSTDPELFRPRDSRDFIMDKILDDLTYAINNISDKKDLYNVTHWTALALKSRICLFEGTYRKYHGIPGYEKFLDECATASKLFIDNAPYAIYKTGAQPYRDLFSSMNAIEEEVILARDYDRAQNVMHEANANTLSPTYGRPGMNKKIVNSYLMTNGDRFTDQPGYETMQYYDEMQNRDPRLTQTVVGPGYMRINSTTVSSPNFGSFDHRIPNHQMGNRCIGRWILRIFQRLHSVPRRRSLLELRRSESRVRNLDTGRPQNLHQENPRPRGHAQHRHGRCQRKSRPLSVRSGKRVSKCHRP